MRVKALIGFSYMDEGSLLTVAEGQELEMPKGANWLEANLVVPVKGPKKRTATKKPAETRAKTKKQPAKAVDKVMSTKDIKK